MMNTLAVSSPSGRDIVKSFVSNPFVPAKGFFGLSSNQHYQTIIGTTEKYPRTFKATPDRINTPDGDFLDLEFVHFGQQDENIRNKCVEKNAMIVILHGLESNSKAPLVTKMTEGFLSKGFSCCLVNFRGCSGEDNLTMKSYHLGYTEDVDLVCKTLSERTPNQPIYLSGFSLGGNVILKFLGELGDEAIARNIKGAAVFCVPFDIVQCSKQLDTGFNKRVYSRSFLSTLKQKAERMYTRFGAKNPDFIDIETIRSCTKMGDFDGAFFCKTYGFKSAHDYHVQSSSKQYLHKIRVPAVAINAIDDPFIDNKTLPTEEKDVGDAPVRLIYTEKGGHCGFISKKSADLPPHLWISEELSRVIAHIYDSNTSTSIS